jgi:integrase
MTTLSVLDAAGRRRSPRPCPAITPAAGHVTRASATRPTAHRRRDRGGHAAHTRPPSRWRLRAMIVVLCRAGLRIQAALALAEHDLDPRRGSILVRRGKGWPAPRGWHGRMELGATAPVVGCPRRAPGRAAGLHHRRPPPAAGRGRLPRSAPSFAGSPSRCRSTKRARIVPSGHLGRSRRGACSPTEAGARWACCAPRRATSKRVPIARPTP